jgi:hypothetical protein
MMTNLVKLSYCCSLRSSFRYSWSGDLGFLFICVLRFFPALYVFFYFYKREAIRREYCFVKERNRNTHKSVGYQREERLADEHLRIFLLWCANAM